MQLTNEEILKELKELLIKQGIDIEEEGGFQIFEEHKQFILKIRQEDKDNLVKEIEIGEENNIGQDEAWCYWYKCPNCKDSMITENQKYCGECGNKFKWK